MSVSEEPIPRQLGNWWLGETLGAGYSGTQPPLWQGFHSTPRDLRNTMVLGSIYRAQHVHSGQVVALKVQHVNHECPTNRYERHLYPSLQGGKGMPTLWASGVQGCWDYLAIDLLGASLDNLYRKSPNNMMDLGSVCSIAMQVVRILVSQLNRLEFI